MNKVTTSIYFKSLIATLTVLSFGLLATLAMVDPECSHCTMFIALRAMLAAKVLMVGWLISGAIFAWDARQSIHSRVVTKAAS